MNNTNSRRNSIIIFVIVAFLIIGIGISVYAISQNNKNNGQVQGVSEKKDDTNTTTSNGDTKRTDSNNNDKKNPTPNES